ncbi:carcinoembryonic antigen-related cell adhesion molecule 1 isoform X1 [Anolis carolinensis]|uniref:carcinoembryonic antigen-related cell adhesion molecule 1 isoform X1 n=1 Tax=Anolis carolinensis TaxID=28377 RepID=UPI002F2B72DE
MELCLLCILMECYILTKGHEVFRISGEKVLIPCEATNPQTRWFWFPLHSRCVNITGKSVEIIQNHTTHEVTPLQFNKRLNQAPESLFLMDLRLSDAGTYVCRLPNGSETRTTLWMTQGCHNNLLVSSKQLGPSSMKLTCHHCYSSDTGNSFQWILNSKRLGNPRWAKKRNLGSTIIIDPIRQAALGRWECQSRANPLLISEICLSPSKEEQAASHWTRPPIATETTFTGHTPNGTAVWFWAVLAVLVIVPAVIGGAVWLRKKLLMDRQNRENRELTDHASLRNATRREEDIMKRESLDETHASLHYAQLQHPRRKSASVRTPDSTTVYAVIV